MTIKESADAALFRSMLKDYVSHVEKENVHQAQSAKERIINRCDTPERHQVFSYELALWVALNPSELTADEKFSSTISLKKQAILDLINEFGVASDFISLEQELAVLRLIADRSKVELDFQREFQLCERLIELYKKEMDRTGLKEKLKMGYENKLAELAKRKADIESFLSQPVSPVVKVKKRRFLPWRTEAKKLPRGMFDSPLSFELTSIARQIFAEFQAPPVKRGLFFKRRYTYVNNFNPDRLIKLVSSFVEAAVLREQSLFQLDEVQGVKKIEIIELALLFYLRQLSSKELMSIFKKFDSPATKNFFAALNFVMTSPDSVGFLVTDAETSAANFLFHQMTVFPSALELVLKERGLLKESSVYDYGEIKSMSGVAPETKAAITGFVKKLAQRIETVEAAAKAGASTDESSSVFLSKA